ncbi:MAG: DUF805 domain-containing protein [Muribaculaceae bacterium]|nr:DUF805 domain-containing protein [Muribaculaceae bacterium]
MQNVDFVTAIKLFFANYVNFKGRSTRAEYWWAMLFVFIAGLISNFLGDMISGLIALALFLPQLAILTRRFHDTGRSGWWVILLVIVSLIGICIAVMPIASSMAEAQNHPEILIDAIKSHLGTVSLGYGIAIIAGIVGLVFCLLPSGPDNKYGPNPYSPETDSTVA